MRTFLARVQAGTRPHHWVLAGAGGAIGIALAHGLTAAVGLPLLMAPFGASCVLLFSVPASPLSQPANVVGGHILATAIGLVLHAALPGTGWASALAVGLAIGGMAAARVTHPPAGADPLVVFAVAPGPEYLIFPVLTGSLVLVAVASVYHRATGTPYPQGTR